MPLLEVNDLNVTFHGKNKDSHIVQGISFAVEKGECLAILGESGSGKSMTMKAIMGLLDHNFTLGGEAKLNGENLLAKDKETLRTLRGKELTMILQNPMTCFDTLYRIDYQMAETFRAHTNWNKATIRQKSIEALEKMQIHAPAEVLRKYPHQLSGGMLQRIMIAIALTLEPSILVADEPTTAIDAITQFEIMKEFQRLKAEGTTLIFITHDLGVASLIADKVLVLNQGIVADRGSFQEILHQPKDAYTKLLVEKRLAVLSAYQKVLGGTVNA